MEGKLYEVEGLSQERQNKIQEMIGNWKIEDTNKRKEEQQETNRKKQHSMNKIICFKCYFNISNCNCSL